MKVILSAGAAFLLLASSAQGDAPEYAQDGRLIKTFPFTSMKQYMAATAGTCADPVHYLKFSYVDGDGTIHSMNGYVDEMQDKYSTKTYPNIACRKTYYKEFDAAAAEIKYLPGQSDVVYTQTGVHEFEISADSSDGNFDILINSPSPSSNGDHGDIAHTVTYEASKEVTVTKGFSAGISETVTIGEAPASPSLAITGSVKLSTTKSSSVKQTASYKYTTYVSVDTDRAACIKAHMSAIQRVPTYKWETYVIYHGYFVTLDNIGYVVDTENPDEVYGGYVSGTINGAPSFTDTTKIIEYQIAVDDNGLYYCDWDTPVKSISGARMLAENNITIRSSLRGGN